MEVLYFNVSDNRNEAEMKECDAMSKGWPDPLHDRGDDFWDFDNLVNEYEWEQKRKRGELPHQQKKNKKDIQVFRSIRIF